MRFHSANRAVSRNTVVIQLFMALHRQKRRVSDCGKAIRSAPQLTRDYMRIRRKIALERCKRRAVTQHSRILDEARRSVDHFWDRTM